MNKQKRVTHEDGDGNEVVRASRRRKLLVCTNHEHLSRSCLWFNDIREISQFRTTVVSQARNQVLRDVLAGMAEPERLVAFCGKCIPKKVDFIDGVVLVSILVKMGIVNLDKDKGLYLSDSHYAPKWSFRVDDDGRIIGLGIGDGYDSETIIFYDLPAGIVRLDKLTDLTISGGCGSLPAKELSSLPHLQRLHFDDCGPNLLENFPIQMKLKNLTTLGITHGYYLLQSTSPVFAWIQQQLPSLEELDICCTKEIESTVFFLDFLCTANVCFKESLKQITMDDCKVNNNQFETLLFDILPRFPNVFSLDLGHNKIQSIKPIVDRIENDDNCSIPKSIRVVVLTDNPIVENVKEDQKEKAALLSLLRSFDAISSLGDWYPGDYDSDVEYALRTNHAGRSIIEGGNNDGRSLPLSVWPALLERAFDKSADIHHGFSFRKEIPNNPTGLYYLIREGPALIGRTDLGSNA